MSDRTLCDAGALALFCQTSDVFLIELNIREDMHLDDLLGQEPQGPKHGHTSVGDLRLPPAAELRHLVVGVAQEVGGVEHVGEGSADACGELEDRQLRLKIVDNGAGQ